jgi:hypothetical protein
MRHIFSTLALAALLAATAARADDDEPMTPPTPAAAAVDPANFTGAVTHRFYPLKPGATTALEGTAKSDGGDKVKMRFEYRVLEKGETIAGVSCTAVEEKTIVDGDLTKREVSYYAQAKDGAVWQLGADTATVEEEVDTDTHRWRAGKLSAEPILCLAAAPKVGDTYSGGGAKFTVEKVDARVVTPAGEFEGALVLAVRESGEEEDAAPERWTYAPGVGLVAIQDDDAKYLLVKRSAP